LAQAAQSAEARNHNTTRQDSPRGFGLLPPDERKRMARLGAHTKWSRYDRRAGTEAARAALRAKFEREVDPHNELDPVERAQRAESARRAFYLSMAMASVKSRDTARKAIR
jgi:hypothetical protein